MFPLIMQRKKNLYSDFVNKELLIRFSKADNIRPIPYLIDGFKPFQRKVFFFSFFKQKLKDKFKVAQLVGLEHKGWMEWTMLLLVTFT